MRPPVLTVEDDPEEWDRPLAAMLLDLMAERIEHGAIGRGLQRAAQNSDEEERLGKLADKSDARIDRLTEQVKYAIERDTGVKWDRIAEANL